MLSTIVKRYLWNLFSCLLRCFGVLVIMRARGDDKFQKTLWFRGAISKSRKNYHNSYINYHPRCHVPKLVPKKCPPKCASGSLVARYRFCSTISKLWVPPSHYFPFKAEYFENMKSGLGMGWHSVFKEVILQNLKGISKYPALYNRNHKLKITG